ncbi:MAG: hypothetical protein Q9227_007837 [Pyrenula ochraceoflavens]
MAQSGAHGSFGPVLGWLATMQSNGTTDEKSNAHENLEKFQKSAEAWNITHSILQSSNVPDPDKVFAATTLKGKITYDLDQIPQSAHSSLRDSLLSLLRLYANGPIPIRTQICVCLARLAIQTPEWKDVLQTVGSALGSDAGDCILDFLRVIPEEVIEGRKINLTEEELDSRTEELLENNAQQVLSLLINYSQSSNSAATNPRLFDCISSWLREIPAADVVNSPLMDTIVSAVDNESSFEAAVECICTIYKDTRDVDESQNLIKSVYPRILSMRPKIMKAAETEDSDLMKGVSRIFAEAGEAWVVLIARLPDEFRSLVEAVLECCMRDSDKEAVSLTFNFWYELKQYLTLEKYLRARASLADLYSKLVDIMIKHLEFPSGDEKDLFDGDREEEDKFRSFRHAMGDVLKDCCEVIGVNECLNKSYNLIKQWAFDHGTKATTANVPNWQQLEAPLFSLRAMGRMVNPEESNILPEVMPLIVQIPAHEKLKFQAIMCFARYTEWTAQHPETLEKQLEYVTSGFNDDSAEVVQAAALAFKFLGTDCAKHLSGHIVQLNQFYEQVLDKLRSSSQEEITEGMAAVVAVQPLNKIYDSMKMFCNPIMARIQVLANQARDDAGQKRVADYLQLVTIFIQLVQPYVGPNEENPAVKYCQEILPILAALVMNFTQSSPILERVCRCWRYMVISYRTATAPMLPILAPNLAQGFKASRQGCFLWATDAVIREFAEGAEFVDKTTSENVYAFFEAQAIAFFEVLNDLPPTELPDVIEDFFRLVTDAVRYYPVKSIMSNISGPTLEAALAVLTLQQVDPLIATLHYLRDLLSFGTNQAPVSDANQPNGASYQSPEEVQTAVKQLLSSHGLVLTQRILTGMMFSFPEDCFADASAVQMDLFNLMPQAAPTWVKTTLEMAPAGSLRPGEVDKLMTGITERIQKDELRRVRALLQDFTNQYRRRNVAPREGLGRLEASRFRYTG